MLIVVNGMPRSGTTLMYNLLRFYLLDAYVLGYISSADISKQQDKLIRCAKSDRVYMLKTHATLPASILSQNITCFYSHRHPAEIALSMMRVWGFSLDRALQGIQKHCAVSQKMIGNAKIRIVRYDQLITSQYSTLKDMIECLGLAFDPDRALIALEAVKPRNQQQQRPYRRSVNRLMRAVNNRLRVGKILKALLPLKFVMGLRDLAFGIDPKSLLHSGHISTNKSMTAEYETVHQAVLENHSAWLSIFQYSKD